MDVCLHHIDRFGYQYYKSFISNAHFLAHLLYKVHKWEKLFLHSCNTSMFYGVDTDALAYFGELQQWADEL